MNLFWINAGLWIAWCAYWFIAARFAKRAKSSESWLMRLSHLVPAAVCFYLVFHDPGKAVLFGPIYENYELRIIGTMITAAGLLFAMWARVHLGRNWSGMVTLKQGHELIRSGPYRLTRHPIYTGFLTAILGSSIAMGTGDAFIGLAVMTIACVVKLHREEKWLAAEFGSSYRQFQTEVAMLVPFVF
jgi:protein-S-isoprenylcysteine O-methyltransferase Ste14